MADDNKNENEDQDDFFGDDDDFGLPDLEYEALDSDDGKADDPIEEEILLDTTEEAPVEEKVEEPEADPTPEPSAEEDSDLGFESDFESDFESETKDTPSDDGGSTTESNDDILSDDFGDDMYSEDDFGDFDASDIDLDEEIPDSVFDSDVLDDDEFKDFETDAVAPASGGNSEAPAFSKDDASAAKGKFTKIVIFGAILFVGLAFAFLWMNDWFGGDAKEVAKKEVPVKKAPVKKAPAKKEPEKKPAETESTAANQNTPASSGNQTATSTPVATTPGTINTLTERSGNSFVVVASFVDTDIAMDYAKKLAADGKSPTIIPPFGNGLFSRVAIAGFPTVAAATQNLDNYKSDYGDDVWVLKY